MESPKIKNFDIVSIKQIKNRKLNSLWKNNLLAKYYAYTTSKMWLEKALKINNDETYDPDIMRFYLNKAKTTLKEFEELQDKYGAKIVL